MTRSTSEVAVCCSNASSRSRVSRATSVSWLAADGLLRGAAFGALRRFGIAALARRVLTGLPTSLERRLTASPPRLRTWHRGGQTSTPGGAACEFRHRSSSSRPMSQMGHYRIHALEQTTTSDRACMGTIVLVWECKGHKASLIVPVLSELSGIAEFRSRSASSYRRHSASSYRRHSASSYRRHSASSYRRHCTPTLGRVENH